LEGEPSVLAVLSADAQEGALEEAVGKHERYVVVVDDAELLDRSDLDDALTSTLRAARDGEHAVIIGGTNEDLNRMYNGFISDCRRSRSGVLLAVQSSDDGELLGLRLPRNASTVGAIGRALVVNLGIDIPAQIAVPH
jgi:S-DNA-T family DNA segregation ATPase FtsK/SpoIIIE